MPPTMRLRAKVPYEEIDYVAVKNALSQYSNIRAKITSLLKSGELIRVKKGLYVFGPSEAKEPYSKEILANLIYGPSYISLDYALSLYGIIPERVHVVTSVSSKKDKNFETPIGSFSYRYLNVKRYAAYVTRKSVDSRRFFLIATPEKALADKVALDSPGLILKSPAQIETYLWKDLRCDRSAIFKLDLKAFEEIAQLYQKDNLTRLVNYLKQEKK